MEAASSLKVMNLLEDTNFTPDIWYSVNSYLENKSEFCAFRSLRMGCDGDGRNHTKGFILNQRETL